MKRRDFLKTSAGAGLAAGAALSLGGYGRLWSSDRTLPKYDMVALMGGEPDAMFDLGIQEQIGRAHV
jgi:hypothetical protein